MYIVCVCVCMCVFQSPEYVWMKVDHLLALSEWLYTHQFPVEEALGHLRWALALTTEAAGEEKQEEEEEGEQEVEEGDTVKSECGVCAREKAVQILVRMAWLQGRGSPGHRESCLAAVAHCCLMWKVKDVSHDLVVHFDHLLLLLTVGHTGVS